MWCKCAVLKFSSSIFNKPVKILSCEKMNSIKLLLSIERNSIGYIVFATLSIHASYHTRSHVIPIFIHREMCHSPTVYHWWLKGDTLLCAIGFIYHHLCVNTPALGSSIFSIKILSIEFPFSVFFLSDFSSVQFHFQFPFRNLFQCVTYKEYCLYCCYSVRCVTIFSSICSINFLFIGELGRCSSEKGNINAHTMNVGRIEKDLWLL